MEAKFGHMEINEARRLKELERENGELKKMLAEEMLKNRVLHVALAFSFQQPRGTNPVQIAVEIEFEQHRRVISWTAGGGAAGFGETQCGHVQRSDEGIEEAHRVVGAEVILQPFGEQQGLGTIQSGAMIHACQTLAKARC